MSISVLKDDIRKKNIRNLYLFYGPEEYLKKYYLDEIEKVLLTEDLKILNKTVLEDKIDIHKIIDTCEAVPVFSEKRLVIVKNSGLFKVKGKKIDENRDKASSGDLISCLQNIPHHTCLVFYEMEIDKRLKATGIIKKDGLLVEFPYQNQFDLVKWVIKVFKHYNKEISPEAASLIVSNSEIGMNEILNEINKIVLYLGDKPKASIDDVEKVCSKSIKTRIFDLTDSIAEKNSQQALNILNDMVILKEPLPKILFMITRQFRHILEMKLLSDRGYSAREAASKIGISPYFSGKILKQSKSFTVKELKNIMEECLKTDEAIKTGKINDRIAAEMLIADISK